MEFRDMQQLVTRVNIDLGSFGKDFHIKRKELKGFSRVASSTDLFGSANETWAINIGGGTEVQYHIALDDDATHLRYGIGFNTQYVPHNNAMSTIDYARPYMQAFLALEPEIRKILPGYQFIYGTRDQIIHPVGGQFTLFGKRIPVTLEGDDYHVDDKDYAAMLNDLKIQYGPYVQIFERSKTFRPLDKSTETLIQLVDYKKQVVIQGPPGTGKTRYAKIVAEQLLATDKLTETDVREALRPGKVIRSSGDYVNYIIDAIDDLRVSVKNEQGNVSSVSFKDILQAIGERPWEKEKLSSGADSMAGAIAKCVLEKEINEQVRLVQFHPSYTYEDFVRGISADAIAGVVSYQTKNRLLGQMAADALENLTDSQKTPEQISEENWLSQQYDAFIESIADKIKSADGFSLTDKVALIELNEGTNDVRYGGREWKGNMISKNEILHIYKSGAKTNPDVQNLDQLRKTAKSRPTYYLKIRDAFATFITDKTKPVARAAAVRKKKFILIIDELNRANLSAVLGELIYALEYRDQPVQTLYAIQDDQSLTLPSNLYIIATMNTADRSVSHIDYAIRRRFAFVEISPSREPVHRLAQALFAEVSSFFISNFATLDEEGWLPQRSDFLAPDFQAQDVWIGHSYFISQQKTDMEARDELRLKLEYEVKPLLREYVKDGVLLSHRDSDGGEATLKKINNLNIP